MIYYGDRNFGCRFKEVIFHNTRTILLENEKISTMILVDRGTTIVSLNYKPKDMEFIWTNQLGFNMLDKMPDRVQTIGINNYYGGWFECFPNVGPCGKFNNVFFESNDEVKNIPFDYSVEYDSPEEIELKFFARLSKAPFEIEKRIKIKSQIPTLYIREKIKNLSTTKQAFLWGHHPNAGGRMLDDSVEIDMPQCIVKSDSKFGYSNWPYCYFNGEKIDVAKFLKRGEGNASGLFYYDELKEGWSAFRSKEKQIGLGFSWDIETFKSGIVWIDYSKAEVNPLYDGRRLKQQIQMV